jgi:hypothetical protein
VQVKETVAVYCDNRKCHTNILLGRVGAFHGNQQLKQYMNCCVRCLHLGPSQDINRARRGRRFNQLDDSDKLARGVRPVQIGCSRGTFSKSQCNQRQEQVGEDLSGNQPDQLSGFIGLH